MSPSSRDFNDEYNNLTGQQQLGLRKKLRSYGVKHHGWKPGLDLETQIDLAIDDACRPGQRRPEHVSIDSFLIWKLRHRIYVWWKKESVRAQGGEPTDEEEQEEGPRRVRRLQPLKAASEQDGDARGSPTAPDPHWEAERKEIYSILRGLIPRRDEDLHQIIGMMERDRGWRWKDIAAALGLSRSKVNNIKRRLDTVLKKLRKECGFDD